MRPHFFLVLALSFVACFSLAAEERAHRFLCCDYSGDQICLVGADGTIEWRAEAKHPQDCWLLPNGNILFAHVGGAREVSLKNEVVWEYVAPAEGVECQAAQPLPNGNVLVVECGTSRLIEVDREGKIAKEIALTTLPEIKLHNQFRGARKLKNGHYLVVEIDPSGKTVVSIGENDLPGNPLRLMAGVQRLPNGNTVLCNFLGHGHIGENPQVYEVTPDNKLVWSFADHARFKTINQIQILDTPVNVIEGEVYR